MDSSIHLVAFYSISYNLVLFSLVIQDRVLFKLLVLFSILIKKSWNYLVASGLLADSSILHPIGLTKSYIKLYLLLYSL